MMHRAVDLVRAEDQERVPVVGVDEQVDFFPGNGRLALGGRGHDRERSAPFPSRRTVRVDFSACRPRHARPLR